MAEFPDSYANDGFGAIYVVAVVDDETLGMFISGRISATDFLLKVRVKLGETSDLPGRQVGYKKCNSGQTHFWLFCFYPDKRKASGESSFVLSDPPTDPQFYRKNVPCPIPGRRTSGTPEMFMREKASGILVAERAGRLRQSRGACP